MEELKINFCVTATYERQTNTEINEIISMHLQTKNVTIFPESNIDEVYQKYWLY